MTLLKFLDLLSRKSIPLIDKQQLTINRLQTVRRAQFEASVELNPTLFYFYAL